MTHLNVGIIAPFLLLLTSPVQARAGGETGDPSPSTSKKGGAIEGMVLFEGKAPQRQKLLVVKDREMCGRRNHYDERLIVDSKGGIQNAVVSLERVSKGKALSAMGTNFFLDQRECAYSPHVLLLPINQSVTILNNDGLLHNIHTFSTKNRPVNVAQTKFQKELKMKFTKPERIPVKCDIHGWMSAWIVVVDHPYHAITNDQGAFSLTDVPPGTYTANCWQEILGEQTAQVTVEAGSAVTIDFRYVAKSKASGSN